MKGKSKLFNERLSLTNREHEIPLNPHHPHPPTLFTISFSLIAPTTTVIVTTVSVIYWHFTTLRSESSSGEFYTCWGYSLIDGSELSSDKILLLLFTCLLQKRQLSKAVHSLFFKRRHKRKMASLRNAFKSNKAHRERHQVHIFYGISKFLWLKTKTTIHFVKLFGTA